MEKFSYRVKDPAGIHARPAGIIVKEASKYNSDIKIYANEKEADAKKIFAVMSLGIMVGDEISGDDESSAKANLSSVIGENL